MLINISKQVLTQNISTSIGLIDIEKQWDNEKIPEIIDFPHFITYLQVYYLC